MFFDTGTIVFSVDSTYIFGAMTTLIVVVILGVLLMLAFFWLVLNSMNRLYFNEKQADVIDYIPQYNDDYPDKISGYQPVVKFEVEGKHTKGGFAFIQTGIIIIKNG